MFMGPFDQQIAWSTSSMVGSRRFIERVWKLAKRVTGGMLDDGALRARLARARGISQQRNIRIPESSIPPVTRILHKTIKKVTEDIEGLRFNTAISTLMICSNELEKSDTLDRTTYETYLKLLAPFAPHATEELWTMLGNRKSIHISEWPKYDPALITDEMATIILQINGKTRGSFTSPTDADKLTLETTAKTLPEAQKWLQGKEIKRVVVVPGKLINIVV